MRHHMFWLIVVGIVARTTVAEPPRVVSSEPSHGATAVEPGITEIRVTYDQDMAGGFSWTGGGETFPEVLEPPRWISPRECILKVRLAAGRQYIIGLNSASANNFRNQQGEAAIPQPLWFHTALEEPDPEHPLLGDADPAKNVAATRMLRRLVRDRYSYRDRLGIDWDARFDLFAPRLNSATSPFEYACLAGQALAVSEDLHIRVRVGDHGFPVWQRAAWGNFSLNHIAGRLKDFKQHSNDVFSGRFEDGIGYICIATWSPGRMKNIQPAFDALTAMIDAPAMIIDVRPNSGGGEGLAQMFAGRFVRTARPYAKHAMRDPSAPGGFAPVATRTLRPNEKAATYDGPVVVLTGPRVMSSNEAFLLMMRSVEQATLVGHRSWGSSGNPRRYELGNGVTVSLPQWKAMRLDGTVFEGEGIEPDIVVDAGPNDFQNADPVLDRGLEVLRKHAIDDAPESD